MGAPRQPRYPLLFCVPAIVHTDACVSSPWCMSDINQLPCWLAGWQRCDGVKRHMLSHESLYLFFQWHSSVHVMYICCYDNDNTRMHAVYTHLHTHDSLNLTEFINAVIWGAYRSYEAKWNRHTQTHTDSYVSVCSPALHSLIDFTIKLCLVATH